MRRSFVQSMVVALAVVSTLGCQSGPRWAWWKRDTPTNESSVVARTAAPTLPSALATPVAVAGTGMATPPSSANLAAAGSTTVPALTAAPFASQPTVGTTTTVYPTTSAPLLANPSVVASAASSTPTTGTTTNPPVSSTAGVATVPSAGPYNPNAYQPAAALASASPGAEAAGSFNRYDGAFSTPEANRYATPSAVTAATNAGAGTTGSQMVANPAATTAPAAAPVSDNRYGILPTTDPNVSPATGAPFAATATVPPAASRYDVPMSNSASGIVPAANVQAGTPSGQYRPAGTSNYLGGPAGDHVEIATRPTVPAGTPTSTPPQSTYPVAPYSGQQSY